MTSPLSARTSGILLHPTSLPGPGPHGEIGPDARRFVDFLQAAGQSWWQMLPIHPPGGGDSPYDSPSAFAGSEALISLTDLADGCLLEPSDLATIPSPASTSLADFEVGRENRAHLLRKAFARFEAQDGGVHHSSYQVFLKEADSWVWDYALFQALRKKMKFRSWITWPLGLRTRDPRALSEAHQEHRQEVLFLVFCQFIFQYQWDALRRYAGDRGVQLMGDIPMFVSHDSVDVWANQGMFFLNESGERTVQAGVPPDYFTEDGQLWGNPLYRWDVMQQDGYGWWIARLRRELRSFDAVRLDHFIAFSRYWEVPISAKTAKQGRFVDVPGHDFFSVVRKTLGSLPFVAEDLGVITEAVELLRDTFGLPGMKVLHFGFTSGAESFLPHRHPQVSVAYLGTHDNDTTRGWYRSLVERQHLSDGEGASAREQLARIAGYAGAVKDDEASPRLIHALMASPSRTAILTVPDLLNEGNESRMNLPGTSTGNWRYRMAKDGVTPELAERLRLIVQATERLA